MCGGGWDGGVLELASSIVKEQNGFDSQNLSFESTSKIEKIANRIIKAGAYRHSWTLRKARSWIADGIGYVH